MPRPVPRTFQPASQERSGYVELVVKRPTPMLIVPGAFNDNASFEPMASRLEAHGWQAMIVRLPARARRLPQLDRGGLAAIDAVLDRAVTECRRPPVVIGHSLGGLAALRLGRRTPLSAAVLLTPATPYGLAPHMLRLAVNDPVSALKMGVLAGAAPLARALPLSPPVGLFTPDAPSDAMRRSRGHNVSESWLVLAQLLRGDSAPQGPAGQPTLVLGGSLDNLAPVASVRRLARDIDADYLERPVGHAFYEEDALYGVLDAVAEWLRRVLEPPDPASRDINVPTPS